MSTDITHGRGPAPHSVIVTVRVNHQPVPVGAPTRDRTVEAIVIKRAAIAVGVAIEENFQISVRAEHGRYQVLDDHATVHLHEGLQFLVVAPDDNS